MMIDKPLNKKVTPLTYFFISILLIIALKFLSPEIKTFSSWWGLIGLFPFTIGVVINLLADQALKVAETTVRPFEESNALLIKGVYGFTRNPMYLGMALILVGIALLFNNLLLLGVAAIFIILISSHFIQVEEKMLATQFGKDWVEYKSKTRPWI